MASRKKYQPEQVNDIQIVEKEQSPIVEMKQVSVPIANIKRCIVFNIVGNKLFLYFDTYGLQVEVSEASAFKIGDVIPISYTGEIGTPDFKKWID